MYYSHYYYKERAVRKGRLGKESNDKQSELHVSKESERQGKNVARISKKQAKLVQNNTFVRKSYMNIAL